MVEKVLVEERVQSTMIHVRNHVRRNRIIQCGHGYLAVVEQEVSSVQRTSIMGTDRPKGLASFHLLANKGRSLERCRAREWGMIYPSIAQVRLL